MMTWTFVLEANEPGQARLLVRARGAPGYQPPFGIPRFFSGTLLRWGHFIMERKQLLGIARRVESTLSIESIKSIEGVPHAGR